MFAHILSLHTPSTRGLGQKVKTIFLKVVRFHIKIMELEHRAPCKRILPLHTHSTPGFTCWISLYPRYEVYRWYIVFAFSVIMFVCLLVCLSVNFFSVKDFSAATWVRILKVGTKLDSDELYCITKKRPHTAYQSLYLFIFLSLQWKFLSQISQLLLEPVF